MQFHSVKFVLLGYFRRFSKHLFHAILTVSFISIYYFVFYRERSSFIYRPRFKWKLPFCTWNWLRLISFANSKPVKVNVFRKFCEYRNCIDNSPSPRYVEAPSKNILVMKCKIEIYFLRFVSLLNQKKLWLSFLNR